MKPSDVQVGGKTLLQVVVVSGEDLSGIPSAVEVSFVEGGIGDDAILRIGDIACRVEGKSSRDRKTLAELLLRPLPRIAWAAAIDLGGDQPALTVEVREFPSSVQWLEPTDVGVDEKIVEDIQRKNRTLTSIDRVVGWLEQVVFVEGSGAGKRALLSGGVATVSGPQPAFRFHGRGWAVDIKRDIEGRLVVTRVVEARQPRNPNESRPITLLDCNMRFVDVTIAGRMRSGAKTELDVIVSSAESYLSLWRHYNDVEARNAQQHADDFGWLQYEKCEQLANGDWRFYVSQHGAGNDAEQKLSEDAADGLVATETPPERREGTGTADSGREKAHRLTFAGHYAGFDRSRGTVDLRPLREEDPLPPPDRGFLSLNTAGDQTRIGRRNEAAQRIMSAACPMPQLGLILEDKPVLQRRQRTEQPLSTTAKKAFGGSPTARQAEALRIALNTPDIALIQGPPGTGKTRVIAALVARLAEIAEGQSGIGGQYLLTSYQHDAVQNVAEATQVFGLPAIKIGSKSGQALQAVDGIDRWCQERIDRMRSELAQADKAPVSGKYRACRDITVAYMKAPKGGRDAADTLEKVREIVGHEVPSELEDELFRVLQSVRNSAATGTPNDFDVEQALKAVRGLRTTATAFSDDGSTKAQHALRRLERLGAIGPDEALLLAKASEWQDAVSAPPFLDALRELQGALIDRLDARLRPQGAPMFNEDVGRVLNDVTAALRLKSQSSGDGVSDVLQEYCDALENDPRGTRETITRYTAALAATCQQAVGTKLRDLKGEDEQSSFDTVIVDEAARANPLDLFIPISLARRRIVLVGDHRQLPHMLDEEVERSIDSDVSERTREVLHTSLFERLFRQLREREKSDGVKRTVTLDVQYRMHPVLGRFVSETFYAPYGEQFESVLPPDVFEHGLEKYKHAVAAWVDMPGSRYGYEHQGRSKSRAPEAKFIASEVKQLMEERPDLSFGVITFYVAQVNRILDELEEVGVAEKDENGSTRVAEAFATTRNRAGKLVERLRVGTVDAFQGKEFDVVLLSMTRSNNIEPGKPGSTRGKYGHLMLENRLCVAMSRQKRLLITVGDSHMLEGEQATKAVPGLVRFMELCKGEHGVCLHP